MASNHQKLGQGSSHSLRNNPPAYTLNADFWPEGESMGTWGLQVIIKVRPRAGQRSLHVSVSQPPKLSPPGKGVLQASARRWLSLRRRTLACAFPTAWKNLGSEDRTQNAGRSIPG